VKQKTITYNLVCWLMRSEHEAEDAVPEAYVGAFRHLAGSRRSDGRAWLLAIVRNGGYERLQQRRLQTSCRT
jgi:RNA polymerase sigma-70 factor (ECF subfamily)